MRRRWIVALPALCLMLSAGPAYGPDLKAGLAAAENGLWREARFRFNQASKKAAGDYRVLNNQAVAAEALGDFAAAKVFYEQAIAAAPDASELKENFSAFKAYSRRIPGLWPPKSVAVVPAVPAVPFVSTPAPIPESTPAPAIETVPVPVPPNAGAQP